jgi:hypothetical protein
MHDMCLCQKDHQSIINAKAQSTDRTKLTELNDQIFYPIHFCLTPVSKTATTPWHYPAATGSVALKYKIDCPNYVRTIYYSASYAICH